MQISNLSLVILIVLIAVGAWCTAAEHFGAAFACCAVAFFLALPPAEDNKKQQK